MAVLFNLYTMRKIILSTTLIILIINALSSCNCFYKRKTLRIANSMSAAESQGRGALVSIYKTDRTAIVFDSICIHIKGSFVEHPYNYRDYNSEALIVDRDSYQFIIILSGSDNLQSKGYGETWEIDNIPAFEAPYTLNYYFERQVPPDTIVVTIYDIRDLPKKKVIKEISFYKPQQQQRTECITLKQQDYGKPYIDCLNLPIQGYATTPI